MKEKFAPVVPNNSGLPWLADLEATNAMRSNCSGRVLMRVCPQGRGETRLIVAVNKDTPLGNRGAPQGDPRIIADMTKQEALSLGMMLVRAATEKGLPDDTPD